MSNAIKENLKKESTPPHKEDIHFIWVPLP